MKKFNIFIFSSSRSDFDLLLPVIKKIEKKRHIKLTLIVSGTHLSKTHGKTINYIKSKHIKLIKKINIQCENVNEKNISLVVSEAQLLFSKYLKRPITYYEQTLPNFKQELKDHLEKDDEFAQQIVDLHNLIDNGHDIIEHVIQYETLNLGLSEI